MNCAESISIACMTNDDLDVIVRFIRSLNECGIDQVFLYLDGPAVDLMAQLLELPNVLISTTTDVLHGQVNQHKVQFRQMMCYRDAYSRAGSGWIGFLDTDEEIVSPQPLREILQSVKSDIASVKLEVREVAWLVGESAESKFSGSVARGALPDDCRIASLLSREVEHGLKRIARLNGHREGKCIVRCGIESLAPSIHFCRSEMVNQSMRAAYRLQSLHIDGLYCVHHDAVSYSKWVSKMQVRVQADSFGVLSKERNEQVAQFRAAERSGEVRELFDLCYRVDVDDLELAVRIGLAFPLRTRA